MKTYKPVKRVQKNVIKCLVKENQRVHDYISPWGVKFWNGLLKESKYLAKNHKVFDKNVAVVLERRYQYYLRELAKDDLPASKRLIIERQAWMLSLFQTDEWRYLIQDAGRLYDEKRQILWKQSLEADEWEKLRFYEKEEIMNQSDFIYGNVRSRYGVQNCNVILTEKDHVKEVK